jgi:hypothetical protein
MWNLTHEHTQRATDNLQNFTLVLVLEKMNAPAWELLRYVMNLTPGSHALRSGSDFSKHVKYNMIQPSVKKKLLDWHALDMFVYRHALQMHQRNVAAWQVIKETRRLTLSHRRRRQTQR